MFSTRIVTYDESNCVDGDIRFNRLTGVAEMYIRGTWSKLTVHTTINSAKEQKRSDKIRRLITQ